MAGETPSRIVVFDYVKVVAKFFIIVAHVALIDNALRRDWAFPLWIDQAVPFFWMISAYLFASSHDRHGSTGVTDELSKPRLWPRMRRVLLPYTVIFVLMFPFIIHRTGVTTSAMGLTGLQIPDLGFVSTVYSTILLYLCGGPGPGGYYIPCLMQMYFVLPILCVLYKRSPMATVVLTMAAVTCFELVAAANIISPETYRLIVVRYGLYLLFGIALYHWNEDGLIKPIGRLSVIMLAAFVLGVLYVVGISYWNVPSATATDWNATATAAILYSGPILYFLLAFFGRSNQTGKQKLNFITTPAVTYLSRAALHIYVFQMFWYYVINVHLYWFADWPLALTVLFCVCCCTGFGIALFAIERRVKARFAMASKRRL